MNLENRRIKIDWGRQGRVLSFYILIFILFYGIIANIISYDEYGNWLKNIQIDKTLLFWTYELLLISFNDYRDSLKILPFLILFFFCLLVTYKEDIPHYGIKISIWSVPLLISEAFLFYFIIFGINFESFYLQFGFFQGYLNIIFLLLISISGAFIGMYLKRLKVKRKTEFKKQEIKNNNL